MKKSIFIIIVLLFNIFDLKAQIEINQLALSVEDTPENIELILHNDLRNNFNQNVEVTWQKIEATNKPSDWRFAICDKITCHYYTVFNNTFTLNPDSTSIVDAHLQPRGMEGQSNLLVKIYNNITSDTSFINYSFTVSSTLGLEKPEISSVKIFPTITHNLIQISSNKTIQKIEVYSIAGKLVKEVSTNQVNKTQIDLGGNNNGIYILKTFASNGKLLSVNKIIKK